MKITELKNLRLYIYFGKGIDDPNKYSLYRWPVVPYYLDESKIGLTSGEYIETNFPDDSAKIILEVAAIENKLDTLLEFKYYVNSEEHAWWYRLYLEHFTGSEKNEIKFIAACVCLGLCLCCCFCCIGTLIKLYLIDEPERPNKDAVQRLGPGYGRPSFDEGSNDTIDAKDIVKMNQVMPIAQDSYDDPINIDPRPEPQIVKMSKEE